jgi:hypothetical protein
MNIMQWLYDKDVIHVRHIHKKPFGRVEIEVYYYDHGELYCVKMKVKNNIFTRGRRFKAEVKITKEYVMDFRDVRKIPFPSHSQESMSYDYGCGRIQRRKDGKINPSKKQISPPTWVFR